MYDAGRSWFPKADAAVLASRLSGPSPAERPTVVAPILDPEHADKALGIWSTDFVGSVYPSKDNIWASAPIPLKTQCPPRCLVDQYLFPVLTRNERLRLVALFYYTRGALEDEELMSRLQEKVHLAQETVGWEFAIAGLLNHNTYTRMVTFGLPLAVLPRRESTCAHTVNQPPGMTFSLPNMPDDWRFEKSPHVEHGGLRAYAGVPLKFEVDFGVHVAFGSLCVASNSPQEQLSESVQQSLVRLADWIVGDIVHSARVRRQKERRNMLELLSRAQQQCDEHKDMEKVIPALLEDMYPGTTAAIYQTTNGLITLDGGTALRTAELGEGLWEDTEYFDHVIEHFNHLEMTASRAVRVIAAPCLSQRTTTFLVVACNDFRMVFDDIDAWFVQTSATILCRYWQGRALNEALAAKETFLRGITHQLRTPIHGILGSAELLTEELKARSVLPSTTTSSPSTSPGLEQLDPYTYIKTIKSSARELISTVNSLIKLNQWANIALAERVLTLNNISDIETTLLSETLLGLSDDLLTRPSFIIQHHFPPKCDQLATDMRVLMDCVVPLMINAAQHTAGGVVAVDLSLTDDCQSLVVDVKDNGRGIAPSNYERIFNAYEKIDMSTTESGLGLTLACKAATMLNGQVKLVSSELGQGSHFRAIFNEPICASSLPPIRILKDRVTELPSKFCRLSSTSQTSPLGLYFSQYLLNEGYVESEKPEGTFAIIDYSPDLGQLYKHTSSISNRQVAICLVPESACFLDFHQSKIRRQNNVLYVQGPFLPETLEKALEHANTILTEFGTSILAPEKQSLGGVAIGTSPGTMTTSLDVYPETSLDRDRILNETTQTELEQSLLQMHIQRKPPTSPPWAANPSNKPMTLLVDDNPVNLRLLEMYCNRRGFPYRTAKDGQQAVHLFSESLTPKCDPLLQHDIPAQPFELVLMDLQMPICDGIEGTRQIRQLEIDHARPRSVVFIVTGQDSPADRKGTAEAGADEYLVKPVGPKVLDQWVKQWFPAADI